MTAKCTRCGKTWQVSIKANLKNYICPHCTQKRAQRQQPIRAQRKNSNKNSSKNSSKLYHKKEK